jgi:pantoate--beta-alanine ligase
LQFNDPNDLKSYPKKIEADLESAKNEGVDLVFLPTDDVMYNNQLTSVSVSQLTDHLCGASRPGHFEGVFTVVTKLFNIVQPDSAYFGQKDIQQALSINKMVLDLNIPVTINIEPIIRESDGLAMSSRNVNLTSEERLRALSLQMALHEAESVIADGETAAKAIIHIMKDIIADSGKPEKIDYISIVDYETLQPIDTITGKTVIAVAAFFGKTRLIDNIIINYKNLSVIK